MGDNKKQQMSEERTAAASYVLTFYQEVQALTQGYAQYLNILAELEARHGVEDLAKRVEENEKQLLVQTVQNIRAYANKVHISYNCIRDNLPELKEERERQESEENHRRIEAAKTKINAAFIIRTQDIEEYVIGLNKFLVSHIMRNLLVSSSDIVNSIYADG